MSVVSSNILAGASGQSTDTSYQIKKGLRFNSGDSAYMSRTPDTEGNRRTWTWSGWVKRSGNNRTVIFAGGATTSDTGFASIEIETDGTLRVIGWSTIWCKSLPVYRDYSAWYHIVVAFDTTQANASDQIKVYVNGEQIAKATETAIAQNTECGINQTALHAIGGITAGTLNTSFTNFYASDVHFIDGSALSPTVFGEYDSNGVWQPKKVTEADLITAKESQQPYNTRHNMAQEWSNGTETGWYIGVEKVFNHNYGDAGVPNTNANAEFTFGTAFTSTKIEALVAYGNNSGVEYGVMVDGTWHNVYASQIPNSSQQWVTLYEGSEGSVTKIRAQCGASGGGSLVAIKSNNRELVDGPADNSQLWSATAIRSDWGSLVPPENLFDGSLSTYTYASGSSYRQITWDAITATSSVEVYGRGTTDSWRMIIDGSPVSVVFSGNTVSDNSWRTVSTSFPCSITGIENNNPGAVYAVRIDGKVLVDSPSKYNASKTWSEYLTSPAGFNSGRYPNRAFVGTDSSDFAATPANVSGESNAIEFTPPTTIAYSTLEVRGRGTDQTTFSVKIDTGSGYGSAITSTGDKWQTIATSGTLTKLKLWTTSFAGENEFGGVRIDGKVLVDGGWGTNGFHLPFDDATDIGLDTAATAPTLDPRGGFDAVTYTGNGGFQQISGLRFAPDFVWIKERSAAGHNRLTDSVRGASKHLISNLTDAEYSNTNSLVSFNSDGFSLEDGDDVNDSGQTYVAWAWKAGGTAVSNTDGTITSTVSADQNYGFSIVSYTSDSSAAKTVGHGLSSAPRMIFFKDRDSATNWFVYHNDGSGSNRMFEGLNTTAADSGSIANMNNTAPSSTVFSLGSGGYSINPSGNKNMMAYCWSEVAGFSKMGSYSGSSNPVTVNTGFAPKFILIKSDDTAGQEWIIKDRARGFDKYLIPNTSDAEATGRNVTFNSDGFTVDSGQGPTNWSGRNYIYAAFADYPANNFTPHNLITEESTSAKNNFGTVLYTGTGSNQAITGLNFQPDLVWIKRRSGTTWHYLMDSVRGASKEVYSNSTNAETTDVNGLQSFDSNGFTVGSETGRNGSDNSYVAWCWKANGGEASSNTDGTITSSVSANPNFGFSIVTYTGTEGGTFGHGLNAAPELVIVKRLNSAAAWCVWHKAIANTQYLMLDSTSAAQTYDVWGDTSPTSTVVSVSGDSYTGNLNDNYVAYCWSEVPGYSRFSSYVGNGSSTGPVIDCGFKPAFILIKSSDAAYSWRIFDSARDAGSGAGKELYPDSSAAEYNGLPIDFLPNGFQIKTSSAYTNNSGTTFIYAAFAEPSYGDLDLVNDTPTANAADPVKGNYATLNPLDSPYNAFGTPSNGNLDFIGSSGTYHQLRATIAYPSTGKWYYEATFKGTAATTRVFNSQYSGVGLIKTNVAITSITDGSQSWIGDNGYGVNFSGTPTDYVGTYIQGGDVVGVAVDRDANTFEYFVNGTSVESGTIGVAAGTDLSPYGFVFGSSKTHHSYNFGQQPFKYTPPAGYKELCTTNLPDPTIEDGSKHFDVKLWDGDNADPRSITTSFGPDLVWIKTRNQTNWNSLTDSVRGAPNKLYSNSTNTEDTAPIYGQIDSFNSDGFTLGGGTDATNPLSDSNQSGTSYVAWAWDAGSSNAENTDGTITSNLRANPTAGFSVVTYSGNSTSGATVGHGLNAPPEFILIKARNTAQHWATYHVSTGATHYLLMESVNAAVSYSGFMNNTEPTSTVFSLGTDNMVNTGYNYVAYCINSVAGYSKIGSYIGNGSAAEGPFVYTGFRPRYIMWKCSSGSGQWFIHDTARSPYNYSDLELAADSNAAEYSASGVGAGERLDFLSNGFKVRTANSASNSSGATYIYAAFAENPFKSSRAR